MDTPKGKPQPRKSITETLMDPRQVQKSIKEQAKKLQSKWRKVVTGDEKKRIRDRIQETQDEPKYVKFFDKVAFTIGVLNMGVCQYFLLNRPDLFPMWYTMIIPLILGSRYFYFRGGGMQYFMIDFCYFTIFCSLLNLLVVRNFPVFFKVCFICCTGPLTLAIPAWRNSFVFHDYDKIVSVYIHILPSMLYYTMRHRGSHLDLPWAAKLVNVCAGDACDSLRPLDYAIALALYIFWQFSYLFKTEFLDKSRLDNNPELLTSLRWLAKDTKNAMARAFLKFFRKLGVFAKDEEYDSRTLKTKAVFVVAQLMFTMVAFLPTPFMYYSPTFHLIYILLIITSSIFNGASFYIEVFSKRYNSHIAKIEEMHAIALAAKSAMTGLATLKSSASSTADIGSKSNLQEGAGQGQAEALPGTPKRKPVSPVPVTRSTQSVQTASVSPVVAAASDTEETVAESAEEQQQPQVPAEEYSVEHLTKLTELLQRTSDSAWLQMREHYQQADQLRGVGDPYSTEHEHDHDAHHDELYEGIALTEDDDECGYEHRHCERTHSHSSEYSPQLSMSAQEREKHSQNGPRNGLTQLETDLEVDEEDLFSPETRMRVNSLMSIDR